MTSSYEDDALVRQYLDLHYRHDNPFGVPNYPAGCAEDCLRLSQATGGMALDLGCAVGRTSFELARTFQRVDGVDLSRQFIETACTLRDQGRIGYQVVEEGDIATTRVAELATIGAASVSHRVYFHCDDVTAIAAPDEGYDLVFAGNLICRLADPIGFVDRIHRHVRPGGTLVMASPYTLLGEVTPRERWLGGYYNAADAPVHVQQGLADHLAAHFEPIGEPIERPFVIRETARKFQHTIAQLTAWRRLA